MKATCPNYPNHKMFVTVVHVTQDHVVDEHGRFIRELETLETTHGPDPGNIWTCRICGAEAVVKADE